MRKFKSTVEIFEPYNSIPRFLHLDSYLSARRFFFKGNNRKCSAKFLILLLKRFKGARIARSPRMKIEEKQKKKGNFALKIEEKNKNEKGEKVIFTTYICVIKDK